MTYFSDDALQMKLHMLHLIHTFGEAMTERQITLALLESSRMSYFDIVLCLNDLEAKGFVASVPCAYGMGYSVTPSGDEQLKLFGDTLPLSIRKSCEEYVMSNRMRLNLSEQITSVSMRTPSGGYGAVLSCFEKDRLLMSLSVSLPDTETAKTVCKKWEGNADKIYAAIIDLLTDE